MEPASLIPVEEAGGLQHGAAHLPGPGLRRPEGDLVGAGKEATSTNKVGVQVSSSAVT